MNEWVNEWMNEWMDGCINEIVDEGKKNDFNNMQKQVSNKSLDW
jgi:hypothetical protein